jgi:hypothetical protein
VSQDLHTDDSGPVSGAGSTSGWQSPPSSSSAEWFCSSGTPTGDQNTPPNAPR